MKLLKFEEWLLQKEGGVIRRLKRDVAFGLKPFAALGGPNNVNSGGTGTPFEIESIKKQAKKHEKKKLSGSRNKKRSKRNSD